MSDSSLVMKGFLSEFNLADVLQVVAMSRQFTAIELRRVDGQRQGVIWIKSGHVIAAQRGSVHGRRAFYELLRTMAEMFVVWRLQDPPNFNPPLGRLPELLTNALDWSRRPEGSQSGPRPLPLPPAPPRSRTEMVSVVAPEPEEEFEAEEHVPEVRTLPVAPEPAAPVPRLAVVSSETLPRRISSAAPARSGLVIAVCSPKGGVGKTTIALNLSVSLAQRGMKTVLVDADINGDQLSLLDARDRAELGAYDILDRPEALDQALRDTAAPNLRLLPATGPDLDLGQLEGSDQAEGWRALLDGVRSRAEVVLVDCPAGMFGATRDVLCAATHVVGVFQSEMVARRSFAMFMRGLSALPADCRPELLGVVVNMFQRRSGASLEAFHGICDESDGYRLFETTIPRSEAFAEASLAGQPVRLLDGESASPVGWLFDMLAEEMCGRLEPRRVAKAQNRPFLL